jgi:hypothetical protein
MLYGCKNLNTETKGYTETTNSREEIHETQSRIQFIELYEK